MARPVGQVFNQNKVNTNIANPGNALARPVSAQPATVSQNAISTAAGGNVPTPKPEPTPMEDAGKVMSTLGKVGANPIVAGILKGAGIAFDVGQRAAEGLAASPQAQEGLARGAVAIGTSPSGIPSAGARVGQAFLNQRQTQFERGLATEEQRQRGVAVETEASKLGLIEQQLGLDRDIFDLVTKPGVAIDEKVADAQIASANAQLVNANARQLEVELNKLQFDTAQEKTNINTVLSINRIIHTMAAKAADLGGLHPAQRLEMYEAEYKRLLQQVGMEDALSGIAFDPAKRDAELMTAEGIRTFLEGKGVDTSGIDLTDLGTTTPGQAIAGTADTPDPKAVSAALAGAFPGGKAAQAELTAEQELKQKFGGRVKETKAQLGALGNVPATPLEPDGDGSEVNPFLLYSGSAQHMKTFLPTLPAGVIVDIDGIVYRIGGQGEEQLVEVK